MLTATRDNATTTQTSTANFGALLSALTRPVDASSVAVFRILFGVVVSISSIRLLAKGWIEDLYLTPISHVPYAGFGWVQPLPHFTMYLLVVGLVLAGLCIAVGYRYKLAMSFFFLGFTYTELIDTTLYLNHYWFVSLTAILLTVLPVNHYWSIDAMRQPNKQSSQVPNLTVWALRTQLAMVYLFAGLAKLNSDWLIRDQPMQLWLADRSEVAVIGPILAESNTAYIASWGGVVFDCTIVGWLLWRRSRPVAYAMVVVFHLVTSALFTIGIFPLLMMTATLVFFSPDWPIRLRRHLPESYNRPRRSETLNESSPGFVMRPWLTGFLTVFALIQVALPLRHYFFEGNVRWTEQGYYGSWRVMLSEKVGHLRYEVTDKVSGETWITDPELLLTDWQATQVSIRPDLIVATAHMIRDYYQLQGIEVEVRAKTAVTLNGRPHQQIVDPTVDLGEISRFMSGSSWVIQLDETE